MKNIKIPKYLKIGITVLIIGLFAWFLLLSPFLTFKGNESKMLEAAKRYYEINKDQLPTGNRIGTVSLETLFHKAFLEEDFYIPYSKKPCSLDNSWVKVKQEDGEYKYYGYLQCGVISSTIDHKGPEIILNGKEEITINKGETYKELGISSIVDNTDGKMSKDSVTIDTSKVNTKKTGTYRVTYTATDSFDNETKKVRTVKVVQKLKNTVETDTNKTGYYTGKTPNNYLTFSGMEYRIIGTDKENIKIIASEDIANVNYAGIDEWLTYYYEHIADESKKYLVKNTYCTDSLTETEMNEKKDCTKKSKDKYVSLLSIDELNKSLDNNAASYLYPYTISWLTNGADAKTAWATREYFIGSTAKTMAFSKDYNLGVRPVLTIKGSSLIQSGDGTKNNPYSLDELKEGKVDDYINTRHTGEYINYSGYDWRIIESSSDGTTKVIANKTLMSETGAPSTSYTTDDKTKIYNPSQRGNVGYFINQKASEYINAEYFVNGKVTVPIYKTTAKYKKETETKKYTAKFTAPNMYDMFSAYSGENDRGYWLMNSSKEVDRKYMMANAGVVYYEKLSDDTDSYIRLVGYLDKKVKILSGSGTIKEPYKIVK